MSTAAEQLVDLPLANGWRATARLPKKPDESGGYFSVGYIAEHSQSGARGFLKALDYARLLAGNDPARVLAQQTNAFNFERMLLQICRDRKLDRIVRVVDEGSVIPPGCGPTEVVQYLIFELADGDARRQADEAKRYDSAWALRTLHQVTVGLTQLHRELIAHQDLKPSNVLTFGSTDTKIADLGRAASQNSPAPHEHVEVAGDRSYAPPECLYREPPDDWLARRVGCDQYLLGSLVASFFLGSAVTPLVQARLDASHRAREWTGDYEAVLPYVRFATEDVLADMSSQMPSDISDIVRAELIQIVRQLCEPDSNLRGHPLDRLAGKNRRSLQRYVSAFDRLSRTVAIRRP